jgi:crotonobetainyl-CoA:carnitine CoA-transferase CaiB-like acyl-CoA transferase
MPPTDTFKTKAGWLSVQVVGQGLFKRWCDLLREEEWLEDPRFNSDQSRGDHAHLISQRMNNWCAEKAIKPRWMN